MADEGVPFQEAIEFLRSKVDLPTRAWTDLWEGMHARAFVVAGATSAALVADFHQAINRAIAEGRTLNDFRKDFDHIVADHGWSYKGSRGWRSRVIYDTNLRMARAAGRWAQIQEVKDSRPFLRYSAVLDGRTREEHEAWHGTILPVEDPWWESHFPPNGWYCRCTAQSLSEADLERYGYTVSAEAPAVRMEARTVKTPEGEATVMTPEGIDTGFGYNVGIAGYGRGTDRVAMEGHGKWQPLSAPGGDSPADPGLLAAARPQAALGRRAHDEDGLRQTLRDAIGGDEKVFTDPLGARVSIGQAIVDHYLANPSQRHDGREEFFPLLPELIQDPAEIWAGFATNEASGRVSMRRRYVRLFEIDKNRTVGLVADQDGGNWAGYTFFRGDPSGLKRLRSGLRIYRRDA